MSTLSSPQFCAHCGAAFQLPAQFCPACGHPQLGYTGAARTGVLAADHLLKQRYRIRRVLGQGGMAAVYETEDMLFNQAPRAVKEMSQSGLSPQDLQEAMAAFKQEAMLLAGLTHPNLPRIYDHFEENTRWYLVMDFIEGETLEARLQKASGGKLPIEEVVPIGIQLCNVLGYLHARQPPIIFRDVKPANVMLTAEGHLYLIDFGIARLFKPGQAKDTVLLGSPGYAAPEQYGQAQTAASADIYSLGATLHQMLSGRDPNQNPFQFPPLDLVPQGSAMAFAALVRQMVEMDRNKRPATMLMVKQELQRIAGLQVTASGPLPAATPSTSLTSLPAITRQPSLGGIPSSLQRTKEQWIKVGLDHYEAGRTAEALSAYEQALQLDPSYAVAWNNKGNALRTLKRSAEALAAYERALQLDPKNAVAWNNKGHMLYDQKRLAEALAAYEQALQLDPYYAVAWCNKAAAFNALKSTDEALAACERAIKLDPNFALTWKHKGDALTDLKRYGKALAAFERAVQLDPSYAVAWNNTGATLINLKRYGEALAACERALQLDPQYAIAWRNKGDAYQGLKRYGEALAADERALQLNPTAALAWSNKGATLVSLKQYKDALAACERALQLDPAAAPAWKTKGDALRGLKRVAEAEQAYQKALELGWQG